MEIKFQETSEDLVLSRGQESVRVMDGILGIPASDISTIHIDESDAINNDGKVIITGDIAVNKDENGNITGVKSPKSNVVSWIRANSKLYHGKYDSVRGIMNFINREASDLADDDAGSGMIGTFMKLPKFWYSCKTTSTGADISFTHNANASNNSNWIEYDGEQFIACYKSRLFGSNVSTFKSGGTYTTTDMSFISAGDCKPHTFHSWNDARTITRQMGKGFSIITYEVHKIMELLFYAYYGDVDSQSICGAGANVTSWNNKETENGRNMNFVSFTDSVADDLPQNNMFWGLCDWWGSVFEWVDDLKILSYDNSDFENYSDQRIYIGVLNYEGDVQRVIQTNYNDQTTVKKVWGKYADTIPMAAPSTSGDENSADGYTDSGYVDAGLGCVAWRSSASGDSYGGVGCLDVASGPGDRSSYYGSRLLYHGPWAEVTQFPE